MSSCYDYFTEMFKKSLRASVEGQEFIMHNICGYKHYFLTVIIKPCCLGGFLKHFCDHFAMLVKISLLDIAFSKCSFFSPYNYSSLEPII